MKSKKVLIVDDNDLNRKLFENLIGQLYYFKSAIDGLEAIDLLTKEHFDLILMDIQMPKMDGIATLKKIQHGELTESPVIAVTAFAELSDRGSFLKMGFADLITKPIRPKEFLASIASQFSNSKKNGEDLNQPSISETILDKSIILQLMKYNSKETIRAVIKDFLQETSILLNKLDIALEEKNDQDLLENLHILKGNSGTLGANSIYLIAGKTETFVRAQDWPYMKEGIEKLKLEKSIFETYITQEFISKL